MFNREVCISFAMRRVLAIALIILLFLSMIPMAPSAEAASPPGFLSVSGTRLSGSGTSSTLVGVDDTVVWAWAVEAYVNGKTQNSGWNMNFPGFNSAGRLNVNSVSQLWYSYFWFCEHYNLKWVRMQNGDTWSSQIMYEAWKDHPTQFWAVLDEMMHQAYDRGIYISLTLAGGGNPLTYGGTGNAFIHSHEPGSAYSNYLLFVRSVMAHCDASPYTNVIFSYDTFNEPDSDTANSAFWHGDKTAFHAWACAVANDTTPFTSHIVEMGTAVGGTLFKWGQSDFNLGTGNVGFDICHIHIYGSAEDNYLVTERLNWAKAVNKPLNVGEVAKNNVYPNAIWPWFKTIFTANGGASFAWMDLVGMSGYPFSGTYPVADTTLPPTPDPLEVSIASDRESGQINFTVQFSSLVTGGTTPYTYSWHFGDGGTSASANPIHTYTVVGNFTAYLTVTCSGDSHTSNMLLIGTSTPTPPPPPIPSAPTISILANGSSGPYPYPVAFNSTIIDGQAPFTYLWTFDDGTTSTSANPDHTFSTAGVYHVFANVWGGGNATSNVLTITVTEPYNPPPAIAPTITISADYNNGTSPLTVIFISIVSDGQAPFTYLWTFDDGTTSTSANPNHTFASGTYHVQANVTGGGSAGSNILTITSLAPGPTDDPNGTSGHGNSTMGDPTTNSSLITEEDTSMILVGVIMAVAIFVIIALAYSSRSRK
jgi:PKD repeat protein